jgi:hypothetical protein
MPVLLEEFLYDILSVVGDLFPGREAEVRRHVDSLSGDLSVIFVIERQYSGEAQVNDDSEGPQVYFFPVGLLQ